MSVVVGDCLDVLAGRKDEFEAVVSDPPSGISFMGLRFDVDHGGEDRWIAYMAERFAAQRQACIPGAYGLFWALPRTQDWTMQALRRAGWKLDVSDHWNITDVLMHVFGQGWPKGKGQLKPAQEAWILCRDPRGKVRPLNIDACRVKRSYAERSEAWFRSGHSAKPGASKIGGAPPGNGIHVNEGGSWPTNAVFSHCPACREVGSRKVRASAGGRDSSAFGLMNDDAFVAREHEKPTYQGIDGTETLPAWECLAACTCGLASLAPAGGAPTACPGCGDERWWCCPVAMLDEQSGERRSAYPGDPEAAASYKGTSSKASDLYGGGAGKISGASFADSGCASRFFPCFHFDAKAATRERQSGCEHLLWVKDKAAPIGWRRASPEEHAAAPEQHRATGNVHATIKPIGCGEEDGLMRWLVRLVTPEKGPVLDGMCGSGSTLVAAQIEGRDYFGCDIDPGAVEIAQARLAFWTPERHRLELTRAAAVRTAEKAREKAEAGGQLDIFRRSA